MALSWLPSPPVAAQVLAPRAAATLAVVATTTQVADFVGHVGGDRISLLPVLGPDDDPHDYQPTAADARNLAAADLVFANGVGLETWLEPLLTNVRSGTPVVKLGDQTDPTKVNP
jgi:zinc/manganese transport system substrate-binding protein